MYILKEKILIFYRGHDPDYVPENILLSMTNLDISFKLGYIDL